MAFAKFRLVFSLLTLAALASSCGDVVDAFKDEEVDPVDRPAPILTPEQKRERDRRIHERDLDESISSLSSRFENATSFEAVETCEQKKLTYKLKIQLRGLRLFLDYLFDDGRKFSSIARYLREDQGQDYGDPIIFAEQAIGQVDLGPRMEWLRSDREHYVGIELHREFPDFLEFKHGGYLKLGERSFWFYECLHVKPISTEKYSRQSYEIEESLTPSTWSGAKQWMSDEENDREKKLRKLEFQGALGKFQTSQFSLRGNPPKQKLAKPMILEVDLDKIRITSTSAKGEASTETFRIASWKDDGNHLNAVLEPMKRNFEIDASGDIRWKDIPPLAYTELSLGSGNVQDEPFPYRFLYMTLYIGLGFSETGWRASFKRIQ